MVQLTRHARPLLTRVEGKTHATQDDHVNGLPTPASTCSSSRSPHFAEHEDINRSPESTPEPDVVTTSTVSPERHSTFKVSRDIERSVPKPTRAATFKKPATITPANIDGKRESSPISSESDSLWYESRRKRQKTFQVPTNIHAPRRTKEVTYGKKSFNSSQDAAKGAKFRVAREGNVKTPDTKPARSVFKVAKGADMFEFGQSAFRAPHSSAEVTERREDLGGVLSTESSPLSSAPRSSPLEAEKAAPAGCAICGQDYDSRLKEDFEDQFMKGRPILNYKWQQRFCRWHKEHNARLLRVERGYPDIDWEMLEVRMRTHHTHLKDVMTGSKASYRKQQLSERLKGRSRTTMQALGNEGEVRQGALVGYYGPMGERIM